MTPFRPARSPSSEASDGDIVPAARRVATSAICGARPRSPATSATAGVGRSTGYYIESFLDRHRGDIRGRVLEIGDAAYTRRFGGPRVTQADVLHVDDGAPEATFVGDLADGSFLPDDAFDCIVLTQTLHLVYDFLAALRDDRSRPRYPAGCC